MHHFWEYIFMSVTRKLLWTARISTFTIWLLLGFSIFFWFLHGINASSKSNIMGAPVLSTEFHATAETMLKALGISENTNSEEDPANNPISNRIQLIGIVSMSSGQGAALLTIDNESTDPYKVGEEVIEGWKVDSLKSRSIFLTSVTDKNQKIELNLVVPAEADASELQSQNYNNKVNPSANTSINQLQNNNINSPKFNAQINAGNGIDPNAPNPVLNITPNQTPKNPNPEVLLVQPE